MGHVRLAAWAERPALMRAPDSAGLRIRPDLIISWSDKAEPLGELALSGDRVTISRDTPVILALFRPGMTAEDLRAALTENCDISAEEATAAVGELLSAGILVSDQDDDDECALAAQVLGDETWGGLWRPAAARFHYSSRYTGCGEPARPDRVPVFQRYLDVPAIALPRPGPAPAVPFAGPLTRRRTTRRFTEEPLDLQTVSELLCLVQHPQHLAWAEPYGWLPRRAYANGGARSELEIYVLARRVTGLDPGIFHYQASGHALTCLGPDPGDAWFLDLGNGQPWCAEAPVHFIVTGVPGRCSAKYAASRALRVMYTDSGCLTQLLGMVAAALGLGAYTTAAFREDHAQRALGIDGIRETPLILLGAGTPGQEDPEQILPCSPGTPFPADLVEEITRT
jgi:SagB-type dehydrogenase family enzyme